MADLADVFHRVLRPWSGRRIPAAELTDGVDPDAVRPGAGPEPATSDDDPADGEPAGLDLGLAPLPARVRRTTDAAVRAPGAPDRPPGPPRVGNDPAIGTLLALATARVGRLVDHLRRAEREAGESEPSAERSSRDRVLLAAGHLASDLARLALLGDGEVAWVEDGAGPPSLRVSPIDVGPVLAEQLWGSVTGSSPRPPCPSVWPSAWACPRPPPTTSTWAAPSTTATTPCCTWPRRCPTVAEPEAEPAMHDELEVLITAAGGRTLALFTSWRAMRAAVEALADRLDVPAAVPVRPAQAGPHRGVPVGRAGLPVRHPRVLAGGRRARVAPSAW